MPNNPVRPKVKAVAAGGSLVTTIVALLVVFGVEVPDDVAEAAVVAVGAITTLVSFVSGYFKRDEFSR